jgi:hypothetical protein
MPIFLLAVAAEIPGVSATRRTMMTGMVGQTLTEAVSADREVAEDVQNIPTNGE